MVTKTQRAYTLRLTGTESEPGLVADLLWKTHAAVNVGVRTFGNWLLTLRGGISHDLVEAPVRTRKGNRAPTNEEFQDRRLLLALSWLTVESADGAPAQYVVGRSAGGWATVEALTDILRERGVNESVVAEWVEGCTVTLQAAIADEAVWVNRSAAFDDALAAIGPSLTRAEVWDIVEWLLGAPADYLNMPQSESSESGEDAPIEAARQKELRAPARQWLSSRFGSKEGADFRRIVDVCAAIADYARTYTPPISLAEFARGLCGRLRDFSNPANLEEVRVLLSGPGRKSGVINILREIQREGEVSAERQERLFRALEKDAAASGTKIGRKGRRIWSDAILRDVETACGFSYRDATDHVNEFSVLLDHAARRVSALHSWVKLAEARRREFEDDARRELTPAAAAWLREYCEDRTERSGALEPYRIRRRAIEGWDEVVEAWQRPECLTAQDRIDAAREVQADSEVRFGDIQLFEALAADGARCVWVRETGPDPSILKDFVAVAEARNKQLRFKVPAYRHPDPLRHPVFCDFGNSRWSVRFDAQKSGAKDLRGLQLGLFDGRGIAPVRLRWHSKRLAQNLAMEQAPASGTEPVPVTRADRLGRKAGAAGDADLVEILGMSEEKYWNGRLQASRGQLNQIDEIRLNPNLESAEREARLARERAAIRWILTFSARLQPQGPWADYRKQHDLRSDWPHTEENRRRTGRAQLMLCRLPGLRVLSVDLGHRYTAACAVWEAVDAEEVHAACRSAGVELGGEALHAVAKVDGSTAIFRRTGESSWARLERQFLVRLPGETGDIRKASPAELQRVRGLERELEYREPEGGSKGGSKQVAELMSHSLALLRRGLDRHARRAGIAIGLAARERVLPGGRVQEVGQEERASTVAAALADWYWLAVGTRWADASAKELWAAHIAPLLACVELPADLERGSFRERKKLRDGVLAALLPVAGTLSEESRVAWSEEWRERWLYEEARWRKRLRWVKDWLLPGGAQGNSNEIRHTGGLSLSRIDNIRALYRLQKAHAGRLRVEAGGRRASPRAVEDAFAQRTLDMLTRLREARVKQTASRIAASALGLGKNFVSSAGAPCHAIVVENLTHYRPDEVRTRRENRQLMSWCAARTGEYLRQLAELHGLLVREVPAAYTSRQDSVTGAPGVRTEDVPVGAFLRAAGFWEREVQMAQRSDKVGRARSKLLLHVHAALSRLDEHTRGRLASVRLPIEGGSIFVSAAPGSLGAKGTQADLNAAANIGLLALMDPDWSGAWWYVPCQPQTLKPLAEKVKGCAVFDGKALPLVEGAGDLLKNQQRPVNFWRDVTPAAPGRGRWRTYADYREETMRRVCLLLVEQFDARVAALEAHLPF